MFECANVICDRVRCCEILGQCIFTLNGVKDNPEAIAAIKRVQSQKKINNILAIAIPGKAPKVKPKHIQYAKKKKPVAKNRHGYPFRKAWVRYIQNKTA